MKISIKIKISLILLFCTTYISAQDSLQMHSKFKIKPWYIPAAEVASVNILLNRFDLYALGAEWADVNPSTWKNNFKRGFMSDGDSFNTNFFTHPYHGSIYYNSSRSLGYSYWQSIPFVVNGSLMWEFLGETEPPSEIDINTTTLGGIYLGEVTHRLSRALLRNDKVRPYRTIRNISAFVLNPMGQFNSWMYNDVNESFRTSDQKKFPIRSQLSTGISIPLKEINRVDALGRAHIHFAMLYGDIFEENDGFKPFDAFVFKSWIEFGSRRAIRQFYMNISSHAPVYRHLINENSAFSISQHYDYLDNQIFKIGVMAITADYSFRRNFESWGFVGTASLGIIPFGSSNSTVIDYLNEEVEEEFYKEYVYGRGLISQIEYMIYTNKYGRLTSSYNHWYLDTENFVQGIENTSVLQIKYYFPVSKSMSLGLELLHYNRLANYEEIPEFRDIEENYIEMKILAVKSF